MKISLLFLILSAGLLSACSPQELFSSIAVSDVEKSAADAIDQSDAIQEKLKLIDTKMAEFANSIELGLVQADLEAAAFAFRNDYSVDGKTIIHVEAIMPDATDKYYEVWIAGDNPDDVISLGALEYNRLEDFSLIFESDQDFSDYKTILITTEVEADQEPEERVMIGKFN